MTIPFSTKSPVRKQGNQTSIRKQMGRFIFFSVFKHVFYKRFFQNTHNSNVCFVTDSKIEVLYLKMNIKLKLQVLKSFLIRTIQEVRPIYKVIATCKIESSVHTYSKKKNNKHKPYLKIDIPDETGLKYRLLKGNWPKINASPQ